MSYAGDPIVDTTALMRQFCSGFCAFKVLYNLGDILPDG